MEDLVSYSTFGQVGLNYKLNDKMIQFLLKGNVGRIE